ncbi:uncharacterized protein MONOS_8262 [Monocercomonoides exilis]|uniref:uncharacterized protein n=1 Tax=Monocercomonoides exilis TaxID=2049356 RepID=UPI003559686B|nr:hypothetical protein MONOS_8262 [Monocercomonoides exilis]|eukprot:MONOS_8262.1-p1 / transcript=MONOS_8262.1 / gene=MONOS_8262 / organism=Monocercomonoides_exilis_PA203 / gene_product=unspecified product / transcript_product=unspecified product / location=Mono_scaffold00307:36705-37004(+) / protein_length=100 / sequence_SO=supercontig / SO=protein_coding / is_pseudo=false
MGKRSRRIGTMANIKLKEWKRKGEMNGRLFGGDSDMGMKRREREGRGREGGGREGEKREEESAGEREGGGNVLVNKTHFSSFCVSSAPFISSSLYVFSN